MLTYEGERWSDEAVGALVALVGVGNREDVTRSECRARIRRQAQADGGTETAGSRCFVECGTRVGALRVLDAIVAYVDRLQGGHVLQLDRQRASQPHAAQVEANDATGIAAAE